MADPRILVTKYTPGPDGLRQFQIGELVRLISETGLVFPVGYVISNDGTTFEVEIDYGGRFRFDLKREQEETRAAETFAIDLLARLGRET